MTFVKRPWSVVVALMASACATSAARPPENARATRPPPQGAQIIALREAQVEILRKQVSEHRTTARTDELCDTLLTLSSDYRAEAIAVDARASSVAPPAEPEERANPEEIDAPGEKETPVVLVRDAAALARLQPKSRALLELADRRAFDAVECLAEWHDGEAPEVEPRRAASLARVLDDLGQHRRARLSWFRVIRRSARAQDKVDAWLAFGAWFTAEKKATEAQKALDEAAAVAASDAKLLRAVCDRSRALRVQVALCE